MLDSGGGDTRRTSLEELASHQQGKQFKLGNKNIKLIYNIFIPLYYESKKKYFVTVLRTKFAIKNKIRVKMFFANTILDYYFYTFLLFLYIK